MQDSAQLISRLTKSHPNKEESEHLKTLITSLGHLPAMVIASRSFTRLIGYQEILTKFKLKFNSVLRQIRIFFAWGAENNNTYRCTLTHVPLLLLIPHSHNRASLNLETRSWIKMVVPSLHFVRHILGCVIVCARAQER